MDLGRGESFGTCVGALSTSNALAVTYEALGAAPVASAIYLILAVSRTWACFEFRTKALIRSSPRCRPTDSGAIPDCDARHSAPRRGVVN